jgi:hypothetical protein
MLEPYYWKESLNRISKRLQRWKDQRRWSERSICVFEREILIAFFCIRKLIESKKLTDECANQNLKIIEYPWNGRRVDLMNRHRLEELYNVDSGTRSSVSLSFAANQMIHSFILMTVFSEGGTPFGLLMSSDFEKNRRLVEIELISLVGAIHSVCRDRVSRTTDQRNSNTGDMERVVTE